MKTENPHSGPQSFSEQTEASYTEPSNATALFSQVKPFAGNSEISPLSGESRATNDSGTGAAPDPQPLPPQKTVESQSATHSPAGATRPSSSANLTGIFRKVQLDHGGGRAHAEVTSSGANVINNQEQGFTQIFQSLSANASHMTPVVKDSVASTEEKLPPLQWDEKPLPSSGGPGTKPPAQGAFTQLFHRLDQESASPHLTSADTDERLHSSPTAPPRGGGFTQLLRTLSAETEAPPPASPTPVSFVPPLASGPGEFTRIISGSMLREAQGRMSVPVQAQASRAVPDNESAGVPAGGAAPVTPVMPSPMVPTPQPLMPPPLPSIAASPMIASPSLPLQAPPTPTPGSQTQAPVGGKLQSYIPLLLIANFFLMLLILILVVFVLLHR